MRKIFLFLGIFLLFIGVLVISLSRVVIFPGASPYWVAVEEVKAQPSRQLELGGNLTQGDKFRIYFLLAPVTGQISLDSTVEINVTDPQGTIKWYEIPIEREDDHLVPMSELPRGNATYTGTYQVSVIAFGVQLTRLALQKMEYKEQEPQYPYSGLVPVGVVAFSGGVAVVLLGNRIPRRKRTLNKKYPAKRKD